jgi:hypothetical protein
MRKSRVAGVEGAEEFVGWMTDSAPVEVDKGGYLVGVGIEKDVIESWLR